MSSLSYTNRPSSESNTSSQNKYSGGLAKVEQANLASLVEIFKEYNVGASLYNKKVCCPFSRKHSNGIDSVPSFVFYPETNSFWCFACKTGNKPCNFVSEIENVSIFEAANIILHAAYDNSTLDIPNYNPKIHLEFSSIIRDCFKQNPNDFDKIQEICKTFDIFNEKYSSVNETTQNLFLQKLKNKLSKKLTEG